MPMILDNIENLMSDRLNLLLNDSTRIDACIGYFNLRGWKWISNKVDALPGAMVLENQGSVHRVCRLIIGMVKSPSEELIEFYQDDEEKVMDNSKASKLKKLLSEDLKNQLTIGYQSTSDEIHLRDLLRQLKEGKVTVKLFLRYSLHAKLYLTHTTNRVLASTGIVGSSNLTFAGLGNQGELNIDVLDQDAAQKLSRWFDDRWNDKYCIDITKELIAILESSWAREDLIPPYYIYLKMAYHISREARSGLSEFNIPKIFKNDLLDFQQKAVLIASSYLSKRGGVIIGDVVGLGKTITATAIAKIMEEDLGIETLIICPKNLVSMWESYSYQYKLHTKIISYSMAINDLKELRRYRLVIIDESHNLRNKEGKRYQAIKSYIEENGSKVILLTATPYNKSFLDLSSQLRLFLNEDSDLGLTPEHYISKIGGQVQFSIKYPDINIRTVSAFEKSDISDDWQEIMKLFMIRRTRSFIKQYYAKYDEMIKRYYLTFSNEYSDRIVQ